MILISIIIGGIYKAINWQDISTYAPFAFTIAYQTALQAFISSIIACFIGLMMARTLYFSPPTIISKIIISITPLYFVMPSLMVILMMIGIYGNNGLVNSLLTLLHLPNFHHAIYGLHGVVLTHIFINIPLSLWCFYQQYQAIPLEYWYIKKTMRLSFWQQIYYIEHPFLKKAFFLTFSLIFLYCFISFAIVLVLGGGNVKTLELAIYQAFYNEFNASKASILGSIQLMFLLPIIALIVKNHVTFISQTPLHYIEHRSLTSLLIHSVFLIIYIVPFLWFISKMIDYATWSIIIKEQFWVSLGSSLLLSLAQVFFAFISALMLIYQASLTHHTLFYQKLYAIVPFFFIALPPFLLLSSYFTITKSFQPVWGTLIILHSLLLLPLLWQLLQTNLAHKFFYYQSIMRQCRLSTPYKIWLMIKENTLMIKKSIAFCFALSLGDFSLIALLGNNGISTLPHYLYTHLSHYQFHQAIFIGLIILLLQLLCFLLIIKKTPSTP